MRGFTVTGISAAIFGTMLSVVVAAASAGEIAPNAVDPAKPPACYGAAARDPERPCRNAALRLVVSPTPAAAAVEPSEPCETIETSALFGVCVIGQQHDAATTFMALVGDSHAAHLRSALHAIGQLRGIHVSTMWRPGCPFSTLPPDLGPNRSQDCVKWSKRVVFYLATHPEIHTVVLGAHARARLGSRRGKVPRGQELFSAKLDGYEAAIRSLPASVTHVIVVRDPPDSLRTTAGCVADALAQRESAADRCRARRSQVLYDDAQATAALFVTDRDVDVVDLTPFMCDATYCLPVVGGVLVHMDGDHLTTEFSATLAPYLDRAIRRIKPTVEGFQ